MKVENRYLLQVLDLFAKASKRKGCNEIEIDDIDAYTYNIWGGRTLTCKDDNTTLRMPFDFSNFVEVLFNEHHVNTDSLEDINSLSLKINLEQRKIIIYGWFTEYGDDPQGQSEYDMSDDFEKELLDFLADNDVEGAESITIDFDGGGDSGYIEDTIYVRNGNDYVSFNSPAFIEDKCYDILGSDYGGWEINEGSYGKFIISPSEKIIYLEFIYRTENFADEVLETLDY